MPDPRTTPFAPSRFARRRKGISGVTYGLLIGLIGIVSIGAIQGIGGSVNDQMCQVADRMNPDGVCGAAGSATADEEATPATGPAITAVSVQPGIYQTGDTLQLTVDFDEAVSIDGNPRLQLQLDTGTVLADFVGGQGSTSLTYSYTVGSGDRAEESAIIPAGVFDQGGDVAATEDGEQLGTVLSGPYVPTVRINPVNIGPAITDWSDRFNGDREPGKVGETISFSVGMAPSVTVTGTPRLRVQVGDQLRLVDLTSASATVLNFTYTIQPGDLDLDGVELDLIALDLGTGATIVDANTGIDAEVVIPQSTLDRVDDFFYLERPQIDTRLRALSLNVPDGNYLTGQIMPIQVTYSEPVNVTGAPTFTEFSDQGLAGPSAAYAGGSGTSTLTFNYTVDAGDNDSDGVAFSGLFILARNSATGQLTGGTITRASNGESISPLRDSFFERFTNVLVNQSETPEMTGISINATNNHDPNGVGNNITFSIQFNRDIASTGSPGFAFDMGGSPRTAPLQSISGRTATFRYTIVDGDFDSNGINPSGLDHSGGQITSSTSSAVAEPVISQDVLNNSYFDRPVVETRMVASSISIPIGNYETGQVIPITVNYPAAVNVSGTPTFTEFSDQGVGGPSAPYASGSGTTAITFNYTVQSGDNDNDGFAFSGKRILGATSEGALTGGTITRASDGSPVGPLRELNFERFSNVFLNQGGTAPKVTGVSAGSQSEPYLAGENIAITVSFSTDIATTGTPRLRVNLGGSDVYFGLLSSNSTSATFRHTVQPGQFDLNGADVVELDFGTGRIYSTLFGDDAETTIPSEATQYMDDIDVEGRSRISSVAPANGTFRTGDTLPITVTWPVAVNVTGTPSFVEFSDQSLAGPSATYVSGSGTTTLTFHYTVQSGDGPQGYGNATVEFSGYRLIGHSGEGAISGGTITEVSTGNSVSPWRDSFFSNHTNTFINPPIVE